LSSKVNNKKLAQKAGVTEKDLDAAVHMVKHALNPEKDVLSKDRVYISADGAQETEMHNATFDTQEEAEEKIIYVFYEQYIFVRSQLLSGAEKKTDFLNPAAADMLRSKQCTFTHYLKLASIPALDMAIDEGQAAISVLTGNPVMHTLNWNRPNDIYKRALRGEVSLELVKIYVDLTRASKDTILKYLGMTEAQQKAVLERGSFEVLQHHTERREAIKKKEQDIDHFIDAVGEETIRDQLL
jgi:hypothetical protein